MTLSIKYSDIWHGFSLRTSFYDVLATIAQLLAPRVPAQRMLTWVFAILYFAVMAGFVAYQNAQWNGEKDSLFYNVFFSARDLSLMEFCGYALELMTALLFLIIAWNKREWHWAAYTLIFIALFVDDGSFHLHERVGWRFENYLGINSIIGELVGFIALAALVVAAWLAGAYFCYRKHGQCLVYITYAVLIAALAFFGVVVDAFHSYALQIITQETYGRLVLDTSLCLLEDGMELFFLGIIFLCTVGFYLQQKSQK